jgi:undecaprenyl phosphate N,N'-diacetylbacillosamine 1-phosphate transferase
MNWYDRLVKPLIDYVCAVITLLVFWPILLVVFIINVLIFKKPLFIQSRVGRGEHIFDCIKFRSFRIDGDESSIPAWGRFLRFSSIDEMPQIINILRGEMSLIGPRPLLPEYLEYYTEQQRKRHLVKPGITGLAQVNGRNSLSWEKSLSLDVEYVEKINFWLDVKILVQTVFQIFKLNEINQSAAETREPFNKIQKK